MAKHSKKLSQSTPITHPLLMPYQNIELQKSTQTQSLDAKDEPSPAPRPYVCDYLGCSKSFKFPHHLKRHIQSLHTKVKPHECSDPTCGKKFSRLDKLNQHQRIHTKIPLKIMRRQFEMDTTIEQKLTTKSLVKNKKS